MFFKEVCFPLEADCFHPLKRVVNVVVSLVSKGNQELVGTKLDVVAHHGLVHPDEFNGEGVSDKFHFYVDHAVDDLNNACFRKAVEQFGLEEACKVAMEAFVTANQFFSKAEARHESAFLEPENGTERAREENTFDHSKSNDPFGKAGLGGGAPFESPVGFVFYAWYCFNCA